MKLRKPSILVVNWVSSCLSLFLSASTGARVNWPVIVHLKTQRNFVIWEDLGCLWGPRWVIEELWAHLVRFRSLDLDKRCKRYGLLESSQSHRPKTKSHQTFFLSMFKQWKSYQQTPLDWHMSQIHPITKQSHAQINHVHWKTKHFYLGWD
jgi:hypothetical protein